MRRRGRNIRGAIWLNIVTIIIFLFGVWAVGLFRFVGGFPGTVEDSITKTNAIVVLTGGSGRVNEGLELLDKKLAEKLFVSGVYQGVDVRKLLYITSRNPRGLEDRIGIGNAVNTFQNAAETASWCLQEGILSLRLVTAAYHMPRSMLEFRNAMPELLIIPNPVFPDHVKQRKWWAWPGTTALFITEYNKFLMAWVRISSKHLFGRTNSQALKLA